VGPRLLCSQRPTRNAHPINARFRLLVFLPGRGPFSSTPPSRRRGQMARLYTHTSCRVGGGAARMSSRSGRRGSPGRGEGVGWFVTSARGSIRPWIGEGNAACTHAVLRRTQGRVLMVSERRRTWLGACEMMPAAAPGEGNDSRRFGSSPGHRSAASELACASEKGERRRRRAAAKASGASSVPECPTDILDVCRAEALDPFISRVLSSADEAVGGSLHNCSGSGG
jgi:hypothetical protein